MSMTWHTDKHRLRKDRKRCPSQFRAPWFGDLSRSLFVVSKDLFGAKPTGYAQIDDAIPNRKGGTNAGWSLVLFLPIQIHDSNDFFAADALLVAWLLRDANGVDYMRQARDLGLTVGFVPMVERKGVVEYLEERETITKEPYL
jgi:hypothetical protein